MARIKCRVNPFRPPSEADLILPDGVTEAELGLDEAEDKVHESLWSRFRRAFGQLVREFSRHHAVLDNVRNALFKDHARLYEAASEAGEMKAANAIVRITRGLSRKQIGLFQKVLWMRDVRRDYENGRTDMSELGIDSIEELDRLLGKLEAAVALNPKVAEAVQQRQAINRKLTERLVELKALKADVLKDERYWHRRIRAKVDEKAKDRMANSPPSDMRKRKSSHQRARAKTKKQYLFSRDYFESELEWLAEGYRDVIQLELLERIDQTQNVRKELLREAKMGNEQRVERMAYARAAAQAGFDPDNYKGPYQPFRQRLAVSFRQLAGLAKKGRLWEGEGDRYAGLVQDMQDAVEADEEFSIDGRFWKYLSDLANAEGAPGQLTALAIFKTVNDRHAFTRQYLEDAGQDPFTWRDFIPDGYTEFDPDAYDGFYPVLTVVQDQLDQLLAEEIGVDQLKIRTALARRPKRLWVVPEEVAHVMKDLGTKKDPTLAGRVARGLNRAWKQWVLLNPYRALKYNLNNLSGDLDIVVAYNFRILKGFWGTWRSLMRYFGGRQISEQERIEIEEALEGAVINSTITNQEVDRMATGLKNRVLPKESEANRIIRAWEWVRRQTTVREAVLRLLSYRFFKQQLAKGKRPLAASRKAEMDELYKELDAGRITENEIAAKLARELMGDYGNISQGGKWLREKLIPFYSWMEINAPRYYFLMQNAAHDDSGGGRMGTVGSITFKGAKGVTGAFISFQAFSLAVMAFNWATGNWDEMEDILTTRRQLHLIMPWKVDGEVVSVRVQGAWSDALEWFGAGDAPADIQDFMEDGDAVLAEKALDILKSPVNRLYRGLSPFYKTTMETLIGYRAFPDLLRSSDKFWDLGYTPIRDRGLEASRVFSAQDLYLIGWDGLYRIGAVKSPSPPRYDAKDVAMNLLFYRTDPGQQAYWDARMSASKWAEKELGRKRGAFSATEAGNALYWYRKSLQWGQEKSAEEWLNRYVEIRGLAGAKASDLLRSIKSSIANQHPLTDIPKEAQDLYFETLNQRKRDQLDLALQWYLNTYPVLD